mgnify:FL=1
MPTNYAPGGARGIPALAAIQDAGKYWNDKFNSAGGFDNLPWQQQAALGLNPLTGGAVAMAQMHKYAGEGDVPGMALTGLSAALSPIGAAKGVLLSKNAAKKGLHWAGGAPSRPGIAAQVADTAYDPSLIKGLFGRSAHAGEIPE